jgi:pimeloyl-ACP methyl ester carboxylesterase
MVGDLLIENVFDSDGVNLHYIDWGGGGRPMVLLAGLGGTAQLFRGLAPRLAERFGVVALTRRGHGRSDRPEAGYDLDTMVDDIRRLLDTMEFSRAIFVGHSWAGIEILRFAARYPDLVEAVIYLDALHQLLEPQPDSAADPVWTVLEMRPKPEDLVSPEAYLAYYKRSRPDLASIWCEAIEADRLEDMTIEGGRPVYDLHGYNVSNKMLAGLGPHREPAYGDVKAPTLAFVRAGATNPLVLPDASEELERAANIYYVQNSLPRIRRQTELFREAAPNATVIELDTSNHTIFIAKEDEIVEAIFEFLPS